MNFSRQCWLRLLPLLMLSARLASQTVPSAFNYQGRLTDDQGTPLPSGEYAVALRVWSNATATAAPDNLIWGRERSVTVINGTFNVILDDSGSPVSGAVVSQVAEAFHGPARFLGLTIIRTPSGTLPLAQQKELIPRQQILSSPFALQADQAAKAALAADVIQEVRDALAPPPGTVIAWMGTNSVPPVGWEFCWGQEVSRTDTKFVRLFAVVGTSNGPGDGSTTFRLPDLRGMFLRGVNGSRSDGYADVDSTTRTNLVPDGNLGNAVGSVQGDKVGRHLHIVRGNDGPGPPSQRIGAVIGGTGAPENGATEDYSNSRFTGFDDRIGNETRPKNVYVHYLIKL